MNKSDPVFAILEQSAALTEIADDREFKQRCRAAQERGRQHG